MTNIKWDVYKENDCENRKQLLMFRKLDSGYQFSSMIECDHNSFVLHGIRWNNIPSTTIRSVNL